jgi:ABC-type branched-subunit amino acid transport system ATPase component
MPPSAISADHLTYRYGQLLAVDHISFDVAEGEILDVIRNKVSGHRRNRYLRF